MTNTLTGRRIAVLAADGVEQAELVEPVKAVRAEGATTELLSIGDGPVQAMNHDVDKADTFPVDKQVAEASVDDYDGLVLPGGTTNPDKLRMDASAVAFVRSFVESGKPVGVICHGAWTLVEADVIRGRVLTSWPSIRTDIRNAGGQVVDREVVVDGNLTSSRWPDDLPVFCRELVTQFAQGRLHATT
nr:type 1 glutamine amidotransferase domain-containing protein [Kibdelosporangium sp. MJ126-NF4]